MAGEVSLEVTEEACVAAYRDWLKGRSGARNSAIAAGLSFLIVFIALVAWLSYSAGPGPTVAGGAKVSVGLLCGIGLLWVWRVTARFALLRRAGRMFRQRADSGRRVSFSWSEEGLAFCMVHGSGIVPWADLYQWRAAPSCFLFLLDEDTFIFIPRSALDGSQARDLEATVAASGAPRPPRLEDGLIYA